MQHEERDDALDEIVETAHLVLHGFIASVRSNAAATKMLLRQQEHLGPISVLADRESSV